MKKTIFALVIVAVVAAAFAFTGPVFAQTPNPQNPQPPFGGMMGQGYRGGMMGQNGTRGEGLMHDEMLAAFAAKLGLTADELEAQLEAGKTLYQVASEKGLTAEQFQALWSEARAAALDAAVKAGKITQEQADWMKTRGGGMMNGGQMGRGRGGMMGRGQAMNPACPYASGSN